MLMLATSLANAPAPSDLVHIAPIVDFAGKVLLAVVSATLTTLGGIVTWYARRFLSVQVANQLWGIVENAGNKAAEQAWAKLEPALATGVINVKDPIIAGFVNQAIQAIPGTLKKLNIDPTSPAAIATLERYVLARLGVLQATAVTVPVTAVASEPKTGAPA